jgi:hypothetical protein
MNLPSSQKTGKTNLMRTEFVSVRELLLVFFIVSSGAESLSAESGKLAIAHGACDWIKASG